MAPLIPIISAAMPLLIPLGHAIVVHMEHLFGAKTGPTKAEGAYDALAATVAQLVKTGKLAGPVDSSTIAGIVELCVYNLNKSGILSDPAKVAEIVSGKQTSQMLSTGVQLVGSFTVAPVAKGI